ncbi:MAG: hypothetical protein IJN90_05870 [Bacilli bacterium]|nr:hypothetical protein [Bacilli bacterium]
MNYKDIKLVILTAGKASRLYPLTLGFPKCLLSVNQKPEVFNMITPMIKKGLRDITFVVNLENKVLVESFINHSFECLDLEVKYIVQEDFNGPAAAFKLIENDLDKPVMLLLGDTLCEIPTNLDRSWLGVSEVLSEKNRFCMVDYNNSFEITEFIDKSDEEMNTNYAAIGIYYLHNYKLLKEVFKRDLPKIHNEYQLSSLFLEYMKDEKMYVEKFNEWEDIGTLDAYREVTEKKFNCRYFNSLYLDSNNVLTKKSSYEKIKAEMEWFRQNKDNDFGRLVPRFYDYGNDAMQYGIEYYDYLTLMEYFCYYPLNEYSIKVIFSKLFNTMVDIYKSTKKVIPEFNNYTRNILLKKTVCRLYDWDRKDLLSLDKVIINDKEYLGVLSCLEKLKSSIEKICDNSKDFISVIHGDPAFSNILFSPRTQIFRFIDPRGNFDIDTIYGDTRYDIAKLRHCYHGRYDEVINDMFVVEEKNHSISYSFFKNIDYSIYDEVVSKDYDINDIELIEGLLFISMLPLHSDYPERQKVFFAKGLECLNNQINRRGL